MKTRLFAMVCLSALFAVACNTTNTNQQNTNEPKFTSSNPSACITDSAKYAMIHSLRTLDEDRLLEMDYTLDYKLDEMVENGAGSYQELQLFMASLLDVMPNQLPGVVMDAGCSAYTAEDANTGERLMGRNYDFCHVENGNEVPITAIMVRTAPANGKRSINMCDSYWMGFHKGFYNDGTTDISALVGAPYSVLDGMNEDGFAVGILHLLGNPAAQVDTTRKTLWSNVLMRVMLDKASNVDEAIEIAKNYNINMVNPAKGNNHFFLADASGNYAILEYTFDENEPITETSVPNRQAIFQGPDFSYVTNFYVDPTPVVAEDAFLGGKSQKGKARYEILEGTLKLNAYKLTEEQAHDLLKQVSQSANPEENTSHTQWSALYNLSQRTMDVSILQEFETKYSFSFE